MSQNPRRLTIWSDQRLSQPALQRLQAALSQHRLLLTHELASDQATQHLEQADIAFGQPDPGALLRSTRLRWAHISTAGYTRYDTDATRAALAAQDKIVTNSSSVYAEPCAQHALAMMLALSRELPQAQLAQQHANWSGSQRRRASFLLAGQTVLMLGFGAIGRRLAELLRPFNMRLLAVRRTIRGDESVETHLEQELDRLLPQAHHIMNLLPANDATRHFVNDRTLGLTREGAIFYNIGRGSTVDQDALINALTAGQLAAAYLDVTDPEPLPPGHPLWTTPNCFITPHSAGGHQGEPLRLVDHFLDNLNRFLAHQPMRDRIL